MTKETEEIKYMSITEFRELGYLQEVNRLFLHPHGLALEATQDKETGREWLSGVWDYRDDPEGMSFGPGMLDHEKARRVEEQRRELHDARRKLFGHPPPPWIAHQDLPLVEQDGTPT